MPPELELYDSMTKQKVDLNTWADNLDQGIISGQLSPKTGSTIEIYNDAGETATVPGTNLSDALAMGWKVDTPRTSAVREYVDENKGLPGALKVAAGQFVDEGLLGLPEIIMDRTQDPLEVAKREALKKEHDLANTIGGVAGFGASLFTGPVGAIGKLAAGTGGQVASRLGAKLGTQAVGELGKRTSKRVATDLLKKLAAKGSGGLVEGAISVAPQAITEAALGDVDLAGETLLSGTLLGGVFGTLTPDLSKLQNKIGKKVVDEESNVKSLTKRFAKVLTGVPEDDIEYYIRNADRLIENPPKSLDDLSSQLDEVITSVKSKSALNQDDVTRLGDEVLGEIDGLQQQATMESRAALDLLDFSDETVSKAQLKGILNKAKAKVAKAKVIDEGDKAAIKLVDDFINQVDRLDAEASLVDVKEIIKSVDRSTIWNRSAGEFSEVKNSIRKDFRSGMNKILRTKVPEYGEVMDQISPKFEALSKLTKKLGTPQKIQTSLRGITKDNRALDRQLLEQLGDIRGTDYKALFSDLAENKEHLDALKSIARKDASKVVRNQGYARPSTEQTEALRYLDEKFGTQLSQDIKDYTVVDSFRKSRTQGSRRTLLGAIIGSAVTGAVDPTTAMALGGLTGYTTDDLGGRALKAIIDASTKSKDGLLKVEQSMKRVGQKFDSFKDVINKTGKYKPSAGASARQALYRLTSSGKEEDKRMSEIERFDKAAEQLSQWVSNPVQMQDYLSTVSTIYAEGGAPETGNVLSYKASAAMSYLFEAMPKPTIQPSPLNPDWKWQPPKSQLRAFEDKAMIIEDPMVTVDLAATKKLNNNHIDALKNVYPNIFERMQQTIMDTITEGESKMSYIEKRNLAYLFDIPLDSTFSGQSIMYYQQDFNQLTAEQEDSQQKVEGVTMARRVKFDTDKAVRGMASESDLTQMNLGRA